MPPSHHLCGFLAVLLGIVSCSAPTPKRQAFPQLDRTIQAHLKTGDKIVYPQLVHSPKPEYPSLRANGSVWAVMHVSETGQVRDVKTVGEAPELYRSAIQKTLMHWRFRPGTINGTANAFPMQVKITFASNQTTTGVAAAKAHDGLVYNENEWMIKATFPDLWADINRQYSQGKKLVYPTAIKALDLSHHPDDNKIHSVKTGTVRTAFIVNTEGKPEYIHILGEVPKDFKEVVIKAIREAKYSPATIDGKAHPFPIAGNFHFGGP